MNANQRRRFRELILESLESIEEKLSTSALKLANSLRKQVKIDPTDADAWELMHAVMNNYVCVAEVSFKAFDRDSLTDEQFETYYDLKRQFLETDNTYFVIEALVWSIQEELTPPAWVLLSLAQGFSKHLESPNIVSVFKQMAQKSV